MKALKNNQYPIRKENQQQRTARRIGSLEVVVAQSGALQSEMGLPSIRVIWSVIDETKDDAAGTDRRRKR